MTAMQAYLILLTGTIAELSAPLETRIAHKNLLTHTFSLHCNEDTSCVDTTGLLPLLRMRWMQRQSVDIDLKMM